MSAIPRRPLTAADVLDAREVAELFGLPVSSVHELARTGRMPSHKIGDRRRRFIRDELEEWFREQ